MQCQNQNCNNLTYIENKSDSHDGNLVQCQNQSCNKLFESQSVTDWIYLNEEKQKGKRNHQVVNQISCSW